MVEEQVFARTQELTIRGDGGAAATTSPEYTVEVVRDISRFNSIAPEWNRLVNESGIDRVFLSHSWFQSWWEAFGERNTLHVITLRSGGHLVAAVPMMRTRASIYGFKADALHAIYNHHTPRYDFIVASGHSRAYEIIWRELAAQGCDLIVLAQIPEGARTVSTLETIATQQGWRAGQWIAPVSPFITLTDGYEAFFNGLGPSSRFNLTKRYARLRRLGPIDVEVVTERGAVDEAMRDGLRIEAAAWKGAKGTAMQSDPAVAEFYIRFAKLQADLGQLRLTFLKAGGKRISFNYLLQNRNKLYAVKIGYDPQYHAFSPGNMLLNLILKDACANGIEEYDLLGGDDDWKFEWTNQKREHRWLFLFRDRTWPRLLHSLKFGIVPGLKRYVR